MSPVVLNSIAGNGTDRFVPRDDILNCLGRNGKAVSPKAVDGGIAKREAPAAPVRQASECRAGKGISGFAPGLDQSGAGTSQNKRAWVGVNGRRIRSAAKGEA